MPAAKLRVLRGRLQELFDSLPNGLIVTDHHARILAVNRELAFVRKGFLKPEEAVGKPLRAVFPNLMRAPGMKEKLTTFFLGETPALDHIVSYESPDYRKTKHFQVRATPVEGVGFVFSVDDVTKQHADNLRREKEVKRMGAFQTRLAKQQQKEWPDIEHAVLFKPYRETMGDFHLVRRLDDGRYVFVIGDGEGHGAHSGFISSNILGYLSAKLEHTHNPARLLGDLNNHLFENGRLRASAAVSIFNPKTRELITASAGHYPPGIVRAAQAGPLFGSDQNNPLLGVMTFEPGYVQTVKSKLQKGDLLVYRTDGVDDHGSEAGLKPFGVERVRELLIQNQDKPVAKIVKTLQAALDAHHPIPTDDQTALVVRIK